MASRNWPTRTSQNNVTEEKAVSLSDVKLHCNIDTDETAFDNLLEIYIAAATQQAEEWVGRSFITRDFVAQWNMFIWPFSIQNSPNLIITELNYLDENKDRQIVDPDQYLIFTIGDYGVNLWPCEETVEYPYFWATSPGINSVEVKYSAGYGATSAAVPKNIQLAIAMMVANMFSNRGDCSNGTPTAVLSAQAESLLAQYKPRGESFLMANSFCNE